MKGNSSSDDEEMDCKAILKDIKVEHPLECRDGNGFNQTFPYLHLQGCELSGIYWKSAIAHGQFLALRVFGWGRD